MELKERGAWCACKDAAKAGQVIDKGTAVALQKINETNVEQEADQDKFPQFFQQELLVFARRLTRGLRQ